MRICATKNLDKVTKVCHLFQLLSLLPITNGSTDLLHASSACKHAKGPNPMLLLYCEMNGVREGRSNPGGLDRENSTRGSGNLHEGEAVIYNSGKVDDVRWVTFY